MKYYAVRNSKKQLRFIGNCQSPQEAVEMAVLLFGEDNQKSDAIILGKNASEAWKTFRGLERIECEINA